MSLGRSRRQKKKFKGCGHRGFGKYCHYCRQLEGETAEEEKARYDAKCAAAEAQAQEEAEAMWAEQQAEEEDRRHQEGYEGPP